MVALHVDASALFNLATKVKRIGTTVPRAVREGLNEGGDKVRTDVRQQMVAQSGLKYGLVRKATFATKAGADLRYVITASDRPARITDVKGLRGSRKGVSALSWNVPHQFKRSFVLRWHGVRYLARLPGSRGKLRGLLGPNPAKELIKPEMIAVFHPSVERHVPPIILKRLARALGVAAP